MTVRSLRVLAVSDSYLPRRGGVERVIAETAGLLAHSGVEVEVLTRRLDAEAVAEEPIDGVRVWRFGPGPRPLPVEAAALWREERRWARQHLPRFDLVHAHLPFTALPLLGPLGRLGIPLVATFYGPWHREYEAELADPAVPSRWPRPLRPLARRLVSRGLFAAQRRVLGAARTLIVLSQHSLGELRQLGYNVRAPVVLVPGGVDVGRFRPRDREQARARLGLERSGRPLLLSVRRLVPRMGLDTLIAATARLVGRFPGLGLAIGGSGPLRERLEEEVRSRGIAGRVRLLGAVAEADLPWLYAAADVMVMPTRALEGFGLPVLEAWACGVPVVATRAGALEETVGKLDPDLVARVEGEEGLAEAIARLLARGPLAFSERARTLAESYRWEGVSERLAELYREAATGRVAA